jgi:hypothetical protein
VARWRECEPCGRAGRYSVARLMEQYGDAKLPELLYVLADCPKARSQSVDDRCKVVYGKTADGARRRAWSHLDPARMLYG